MGLREAAGTSGTPVDGATSVDGCTSSSDALVVAIDDLWWSWRGLVIIGGCHWGCLAVEMVLRSERLTATEELAVGVVKHRKRRRYALLKVSRGDLDLIGYGINGSFAVRLPRRGGSVKKNEG